MNIVSLITFRLELITITRPSYRLESCSSSALITSEDVSAKIKKIWNNVKFFRSLRARIFIIVFLIGIIPGIVLRYGILENYEDGFPCRILYWDST